MSALQPTIEQASIVQLSVYCEVYFRILFFYKIILLEPCFTNYIFKQLMLYLLPCILQLFITLFTNNFQTPNLKHCTKCCKFTKSVKHTIFEQTVFEQTIFEQTIFEQTVFEQTFLNKRFLKKRFLNKLFLNKLFLNKLS